jgi:tetratricopeptide (TPR) repeat protein
MKTIKLLIALIGMAALPFAVAAQDIDVEFVDGTVDLKQGNDWETIYIGDAIGRDSIIHVGEGGIVELSGADVRLTVSNAGTYSLAELLSGTAAGSSKNLQSFLQNSLSVVMEKSKTSTSAAQMGVRAAEQKTTFEWIDEDEELLAEGRALIEDGAYAEAAEFFADELEYAEDYIAGHYRFYLGYAQAMLGKKGLALKELGSIEAKPSDEYFEDWSLTYGQLLYESLAFDSSLAVFKAYIESFPEGKNAQEAYAFTGLCYQQQGDASAAAENFKRAIELDPNSEVGELVATWTTN